MVLGQRDTHWSETPIKEPIAEAPVRQTAPAPEPASVDAEEDDTLSYFAKLAEED